MEIFADFCRTISPREIFDIGANTGVYGLIAKAILPKANVSFFEPIPKALEMIEKNLSINNFSGDIFKIALSDFDGKGSFFLPSGQDMAYSVTLNAFADEAIDGVHDQTRDYNELFAKVSRVDTLIDAAKCDIPDLVKLDVETHEPEVLRGFGKYLSSSTSFLIEVLTDRKAAEINAILDGLGYDFWNIDDRKGTVRKTADIEKSDFFNYFVCRPEISQKLVSLRVK